jgi:malonyl CoA-acyl carrier protein transacylase
MTALEDFGSEFYVDAGPGRVLSKLVPRNVEGASAVTAEALLEDIGARV